jgi:hypothetical protein
LCYFSIQVKTNKAEFNFAIIQTMNTSSLETMKHRSQTLENPEAIELLHNPKYRNLIRYFMQQPQTIQAAAEHTKQSPQRTYNYIQRLQKTGFLEVTAQEARRGKSLKFYATTADDYFVPFIATQALGYTEIIHQELQVMQSQMLRVFEDYLSHRNPLEWGTRLFKDPQGQTHLSFTPAQNWKNLDYLTDVLQPENPAMLNFWAEIKLPKPQAKALQLELMQVWRKYYFAAHTEPKPETLESYGMGILLVPMPN